MDFATILQPDQCAGHVEVHDDSLGGLGILVDDSSSFEAGVELELLYAGSRLLGTICHVTQQTDGLYLVGIDCRTRGG